MKSSLYLSHIHWLYNKYIIIYHIIKSTVMFENSFYATIANQFKFYFKALS